MIDFENFGTHLGRLTAAIDAADWSPTLGGAVRDQALQGIRDNFTSSADPDNQSWPARKVVGDGHPLLIDTGKLMQAATGGGAGRLSQVTSRELALGVNPSVVPYAAVHNNGGSKMPKREYMGNRPERLDAIEEIIADAGLEILGRVPDA